MTNIIMSKPEWRRRTHPSFINDATIEQNEHNDETCDGEMKSTGPVEEKYQVNSSSECVP